MIKKIINFLRFALSPFIKKLVKPFIKSIGLRKKLRELIGGLIILSQGDRKVLKKNLLKFNYKELKKYGISINRNCINKSLFPKDIQKEINDIISIYKSEKEVLNFNSGNPFKNGEALKKSFYVKRGINLRNNSNDYPKKNYYGKDNGLIDIFNPHLLLPKSHWINKLLDESKKIISNTINFEHYNINYTHSNLYVYENVKEPRCLHVDSYKNQFKCFIPLNPVLNEEKGCYSYVPSSHRIPLNIIQIFSRLLNFLISNSDLGYMPSNDANLFDIKTSFPILVNIGDLIITCQKGVHGDYPSKNPINR